MTAVALLVRQIQRGQEGFLRMVNLVPEDKLDWQPDPKLRSALDQYQEVATILDFTWDVFDRRELKFGAEDFQRYKAHSKTFATREACEAEFRRTTDELIARVRALSDADLDDEVKMPFPGEYRLCDTIQYHVWNMAYHEGQIAAILQRLGVDPM
ncbi:MAG: hypothetical protein AMXMBFR81_11480 [Chthonomonas sp.]